MKYLIIDTNHLLYRARFSSPSVSDILDQTGLALHTVLYSVKKLWTLHQADHVVFCMDGRSWRKDYYEPYKKNRISAKNLKPAKEIENDEYFFSTMNEFVQFLDERTNCTVLHEKSSEADDLVARFIALHPDDEHIMVTSDMDYVQLIAPNVTLYDAMNEYTITPSRITDKKGNTIKFSLKNDGKIKYDKPDKEFIPDGDWIEKAKFLKIVRGDTSDNISSILPKVRQTRLDKIFEDRHNRGYEWNNFILESWVDGFGESYKVKDLFERNTRLVDLTQQPQEIKDTMDLYIANKLIEAKEQKNIGFYFMKFASRHELKRILDNNNQFVQFLSAPYAKKPVDNG